MHDDPRLDRIARNEILLREANKRIESLTEDLIDEGFAQERERAEFFCACGRPDCDAKIPLSVAEYDAVRSRPNRFIVVPGHENPIVERIVEEHEAYLVVEKRTGFWPEDEERERLQGRD